MTTEERLEHIERELTAMKRRKCQLLAVGGLAIVGLGLAWILTNSTPTAQAQGAGFVPKEVRANSFIVEDSNGKMRAALSIGANGPSLFLLDANGKMRATLALGANGPSLALNDANKEIRASLALGANGPSLALNDANGKNVWSAP